MKHASDAFPQIDYDVYLEVPDPVARDATPINDTQADKIDELVDEINQFTIDDLEVAAGVIDDLGTTQANKLIRGLKKQKARVLALWRKQFEGRVVTLKGNGYKLRVTLGEVDEEPTQKQLGYLDHLLVEHNVRGCPPYHALGKYDVSQIIDSILSMHKKSGGKSAKKKDESSGCGTVIVVIVVIIVLIAWLT